jgi:hypothetical protein
MVVGVCLSWGALMAVRGVMCVLVGVAVVMAMVV